MQLLSDSETYSSASLAALLFSSSLYLLAAFEVYFTLASLLAKAALPPFDWKYLVADSFPPTFIVRNCAHCHTSKFVERTKDICTPKFRWLEEQSRQRYTPNGTDDQVGFFCPQSKHIYSVVSIPFHTERSYAYLVSRLAFQLLEYFL